MTYAAMSTETLRQIEQNARAAVAEGEAGGASKAVMKARYGVLGAVSAVLASRKEATTEVPWVEVDRETVSDVATRLSFSIRVF